MGKIAGSLLKNLSSKYHLIGFFIAIFLFLFVTVVTIKKTSQLNDSDKIIQHTYEVKLLADEILVDLLAVESGKRAFMLAGDTNFIKPYYYSKESIAQKVTDLKQLVSDDQTQTTNVNSLALLVDVRYQLFDKVVKEITETRIYKYTNEEIEEGRLIMEKTREKINEIKKHESLLLEKRKEESRNLKSRAPVYLLLANLLSLIVILYAYNKINRDFKTSQSLANKYNLSNQVLLQSQKIGNIGQWILNLKSGRLEINEQHFLQLGYDPKTTVWTFPDYIEKIHADDRHLLQDDERIQGNSEETKQLMFRMKRENGEYAYLKTQLKKIQNNNEDLIVGVAIDETANVKIQTELQQRNESLISLNQELSSFNYIASHDLQEPLRKIQMFISRLVTDEKTALSEKAQQYFTKVRESANRMQNLIKDLLAYSRLGKSHQAFEVVDLNVVLQRVQEEWGQWIEENNVTMKVKELPTVQGVPFLLQALFSNLVSNALKYSDPSRKPEIDVTHAIVERKGENSESSQLFHQISVSDNGIGFDNAFSGKIFELFQRLHEKNQYPGTGIGLAICKKIAEVHQGTIYASGRVNSGSTFVVELPVTTGPE